MNAPRQMNTATVHATTPIASFVVKEAMGANAGKTSNTGKNIIHTPHSTVYSPSNTITEGLIGLIRFKAKLSIRFMLVYSAAFSLAVPCLSIRIGSS